MGFHRLPASGPEPEVVVWAAPSEFEEAGLVANLILDIVDADTPYRESLDSVGGLSKRMLAAVHLIQTLGCTSVATDLLMTHAFQWVFQEPT